MAGVVSRRIEPFTWCWRGIGLLLAVGLVPMCGAMAVDLPDRPQPPATLASEKASRDTQRLATWIVAHDDARGLPFLIVDKTDAVVFAVDREGRLAGAAAALLGLAHGDDSPVGIGERKLSAILPRERITPSGRFVAALGKEPDGKEILWVDYAAGVALHPVITTNPSERRLQRLASPSVADNRISYGCINVPATFFDKTVLPLFEEAGGIVYILPETRSIDSQFFGAPSISSVRVRAIR